MDCAENINKTKIILALGQWKSGRMRSRISTKCKPPIQGKKPEEKEIFDTCDQMGTFATQKVDKSRAQRHPAIIGIRIRYLKIIFHSILVPKIAISSSGA